MTDVNTMIGHLFRHHAGKMAAVLSRTFGVAQIDRIEDSIQDAMVTAMKRWPFTGTPDNPTAWLTQVAKNSIIDQLRREKGTEELDDADTAYDADAPPFASEIAEDQLRMIFACCHPSISPDSQVAITLKIVSGFSAQEIARGFLSSESSVAKLLTRAKANLRSGEVSLEIPFGDELKKRVISVLKVLYLMFNEGYRPTTGDEVVREDLCFEALRLGEILAGHNLTNSPRVHALAALFCFHAARLRTRGDGEGSILLLIDQDRSQWDRDLIGRGLAHMRLAAAGTEITEYHLEAEIAMMHATAETYSAIDWQRIADCYERLLSIRRSPIFELNRIIALGEISGPTEALARLDNLAAAEELEDYLLFHATKGNFLGQLGRNEEAQTSYETAHSLADNDASRRFISGQIGKLGNRTNN